MERGVLGYGKRRTSSGGSTAVEIIEVLIAGIIIGFVGKWVAPGDKDNTPLWLTILCGIVGALIGWIIYAVFGGNGSPGIDWTRWIIAGVCAAILVVIASTLTGRNKVNLPRLSVLHSASSRSRSCAAEPQHRLLHVERGGLRPGAWRRLMLVVDAHHRCLPFPTPWSAGPTQATRASPRRLLRRQRWRSPRSSWPSLCLADPAGCPELRDSARRRPTVATTQCRSLVVTTGRILESKVGHTARYLVMDVTFDAGSQGTSLGMHRCRTRQRWPRSPTPEALGASPNREVLGGHAAGAAVDRADLHDRLGPGQLADDREQVVEVVGLDQVEAAHLLGGLGVRTVGDQRAAVGAAYDLGLGQRRQLASGADAMAAGDRGRRRSRRARRRRRVCRRRCGRPTRPRRRGW